MKNQYQLTDDDIALFKQSIGQTKQIKQDKVVHSRVYKTIKIINEKKQQQEQLHAEFYFSDDYQPLLHYEPVRFSRENADPYEIKKLRRGFYEPDFFLDLHGLTQQESKREISSLIAACLRERVQCASIMYGHGKNILKKQTPLWLAQHPNVICFHEAPKEFGGSAAVLVLFDLIE